MGIFPWSLLNGLRKIKKFCLTNFILEINCFQMLISNITFKIHLKDKLVIQKRLMQKYVELARLYIKHKLTSTKRFEIQPKCKLHKNACKYFLLRIAIMNKDWPQRLLISSNGFEHCQKASLVYRTRKINGPISCFFPFFY